MVSEEPAYLCLGHVEAKICMSWSPPQFPPVVDPGRASSHMHFRQLCFVLSQVVRDDWSEG